MNGSTSRRTWLGTIHQRGLVGHSRYALTFDDGPLAGASDAILDCLKRLGVPATFFVIGMNAEREPDLVRRMAAEGHIVGNHSWTHSRLGMCRGRWYWGRQLERTATLIEQLIGRRPAMFRPPMGVRTPHIAGAARRSGHACIMWTRRGFDGVATTPQRIIDRVMETASDGDVIVLHDGRERASRRDPQPTIDALPTLVERLHARGLRPAPLDALLNLPAYQSPRPSAEIV